MQPPRRSSAVGRHGPAWMRAAAAIALFALFGIGHALPALHFALVAHRICAEHGELLHESAALPSVEAGSRSGLPELASASASASARSVPACQSAVAGQHAEHGHEHCGVLALPASFGVSPFAAREPSAPSRPLDDVSVAERPAHVAIELLLRAPKLAPPA